MSYSICFIVKSENVVKALRDHSEKITGQSKEEYDDVLPAFVKLVENNFNPQINGLVKIEASGHGTKVGDEYTQKYCAVNVSNIYGVLV
jgi:hypothetical protein